MAVLEFINLFGNPQYAHATRLDEATCFYFEGRPAYPRLLGQRVSELIGLERAAEMLIAARAKVVLRPGVVAHS